MAAMAAAATTQKSLVFGGISVLFIRNVAVAVVADAVGEST